MNKPPPSSVWKISLRTAMTLPSLPALIRTRFFVRPSTGQALAFDRDCHFFGAHGEKFRQIAMQVLSIAMLLSSLHPALED
jgi:hypothetical protein